MIRIECMQASDENQYLEFDIKQWNADQATDVKQSYPPRTALLCVESLGIYPDIYAIQ
jgi:hypothetical protein